MNYLLKKVNVVKSLCVAAVLLGASHLVASDSNYISPQDAGDGSGNAVAVYMAQNSSGNYVIKANTRIYGSAWSSPLQLSVDTESAQNIRMMGDASTGVVLVTWTALDATAGTDFVLAATWSAAAGWSSTYKISLSTEDAAWDDQRCTIDASGVMTVVYTSYVSSTQVIRSVQGLYGTTGNHVGPWNNPITIATP